MLHCELASPFLCCAVPCCAMLCQAVPCCARLCCAVPCCAVPCCAVLCRAMLRHAVPCHAVLCHAVLCHAVLCHAALFLAEVFDRAVCTQVGLNLAGGSSLLPYTNKTRDILVAAFRKSVNNDGRVRLLTIVVSLMPYTSHIMPACK